MSGLLKSVHVYEGQQKIRTAALISDSETVPIKQLAAQISYSTAHDMTELGIY